MISYLVDAVLLVALAITSVKIVAMYRELKRLGGYHADYRRIFDQTTLALDGIEVSIQEINVRGAQVLNALGSRMDDARGIIADIDALTRDARKHQAALRSEMRALQSERELSVKAQKMTPRVEEMENRTPPREKTRFQTGQGNRLAVETNGAAMPASHDMRIHRIDDTTYANSFRSVSVGEKDTAK